MKLRALMMLAGVALVARADDWPQFRGVNRNAVWNETGIMQTFPKEGLATTWKTSVGNGLSSPVIAEGRVYLIGSELQKPKVTSLSPRDILRCLRLKVWDTELQRMVPLPATR